jgi:hypothetical protein
MALSRRSVVLMVAALVGGTVLVLSPLYWLFSGPHYEFEATEVRAAVEGTWTLTTTAPDGAPQTWTFKLAQSGELQQRDASSRSLVRSAAACGKRSLVKPAGACVDATHMPLDVTLLTGSGTPRVAGGEFTVFGTQFKVGYLDLSVREIKVSARVTPLGDVVEVSGGSSAATLVRISH